MQKVRFSWHVCCVVTVALVVVASSWAWAEKTQETQTARRIYIEGARFMQQKRYEEAAVQFRLAYRLLSKENNPKLRRALIKLRYFLGFCYFKLKKYKNAKKFLAQYLQTTATKSGPRYLRAQQMRVESIRRVAMMPRRVRKPPSRPKVVVVEKKVIKKVVVKAPKRPWRAWPFVVMGIGVATIVAGSVTGGLTNGAVAERDQTHQSLLDASDPFSNTVAQLHKKAEMFALTTNALLIGGGVVTALGVILIFTSGRGAAKLPPPTNPKNLSKNEFLLPEVQ